MRFPVDLHTHTIASDHAYSTIHEYVLEADRKGISMFAVTDHGPDVPDAPHPWHFGNLRVVPNLIDDIAVLRGVEANIRIDGSLDLEDHYLNRLDIVLAGFHPNYEPTNEEEHTRLAEIVIKSGKVDIITHLGNPRYPINMRKVLECAKENNVAVELNSSSDVNTRMGSTENCIEIAKLAKEIGNTIALGSDAHICYYLGCFSSLESIIENAGIRYDQIINTSPVKVLDFLESRGRKPIEKLRKFYTRY